MVLLISGAQWFIRLFSGRVKSHGALFTPQVLLVGR
jgi:hypothetical protein